MLSENQIEFLVCEMGVTVEEVRNIIDTDKDKLIAKCTEIVCEEVNFSESEDIRLNYGRLDMAEELIAELMDGD